jgi:hypothetical protein
MIFVVNRHYVVKQNYQLVFALVNCCVFFEERAEFLNII